MDNWLGRQTLLRYWPLRLSLELGLLLEIRVSLNGFFEIEGAETGVCWVLALFCILPCFFQIPQKMLDIFISEHCLEMLKILSLMQIWS